MIELNNITKKYENGFVAIKGISVKLPSQGLVSIVGESGAGKSTILNILSGNDTPTTGSISFNGLDYKDIAKDVNKIFSYIYQDYKIIEGISVFENVKIATELAGGCSDDDKISNLLDKVGLKPFENEIVNNLSGGQKQRVAIARSLSRMPKVILADEPTGNLDSENKKLIFSLLQEVSKNILVVVVTHDVVMAKAYSNEVITLSDGEIFEKCESNELILSEKNVEFTKNKGKLSGSSILKLAKVFNFGQKSKRIALAITSIILICMLLTSLTWSFLTFERSIYNTVKKSNSNAIAIMQKQHHKNQSDMPQFYNDLSSLKDYMSNKMGIETAQVYPKNFLNIRENSCKNISIVNQDLSNKSIYDDVIINKSIDYVIVADNLSNIGFELSYGRMPSEHNEILIPKSKIEVLLAEKSLFYNLGGTAESITKEINDISDVFATQFGDIKIVGAFDDHLILDEEYKKIASTVKNSQNSDLLILPEKDLNSKIETASKIVQNNYLSKCVIVGSDALNYYNSLMYYSASGEYRETDVKVKVLGSVLPPFSSFDNSIGIAPQNKYTQTLFKEAINLKSNEIALSSGFIDRFMNGEEQPYKKYQVGDVVKLSSFKGYREMDDYQDIEGFNKFKSTELLSSKEFKIVEIIENTSVMALLTQEDFNLVSGKIKLNTVGLVFDNKHLKLNDLMKINKFIDKNISEVDIANSYTAFYHNNDDSLIEHVGIAIILKKVIAIALSLILLAIITLIIYVTYNSSIKNKSNEILILRSLGASKSEIFKIFFIHSAIFCAIQLVLGVALGMLLVYALNYIAVGAVIKGAFTMFSFNGIAFCITILALVLINVATLLGNIFGMNDKNLRKAFQKTKL